MPAEWQELTRLTAGAPVVVERVHLAGSEIAIEGSFELPPLANLSAEDQVFIIAFLRSDGSIKEMERLFGVSYPTIKNRLSRLATQFEFVEVESAPARADVLAELERGEITAEEAIGRLSS